MADLFMQAGLKNISQTEVSGKMNSQTTDVYWTMMTEVGAPIVAALSKANAAINEIIKNEVYQLVNDRYSDGKVLMDSSSLVIYGEK